MKTLKTMDDAGGVPFALKRSKNPDVVYPGIYRLIKSMILSKWVDLIVNTFSKCIVEVTEALIKRMSNSIQLKSDRRTMQIY